MLDTASSHQNKERSSDYEPFDKAEPNGFICVRDDFGCVKFWGLV